ncbi:da6a4bb9-e93e-481b-ba9f-35eb6b8a01e0 [Sclerotinia trifoliorum]|uniref:Da6a4bb9-e93e-481b-ba9f-35eb6b8a01e0 n=1 Tax=Sclerotinia trifoliorum TaxID=28548 RepID=A0A8H2ZX97_9HELO|nr:da6a4bb9-e93e-481b-ba9f-35eb6b8a01e0 [Sclerotinia trifoliorum]
MGTSRNRKRSKHATSSIPTKGNGHKIIIGIDYGTTFSGVSYVTTDKSGIEDITIMSPWPGDPHVSWKTPTRIAYSQENPKLKNNKWGFEVNSKLKSYSWTKLLLDKSASAKDHDDPSLASMTGGGMLQLPPFRDAAGVCEDFLTEVYTHVSRKLREQMTDLTFENTPMECWVTLPAVWSEEAKDATLKAAKSAGFGKRPGDEIYTIAEPEAAAIATLKEYAKSDGLNPISCDENILICDCGGGTIDITTYRIRQVQPYLIFDELCVGIGGKCGATYIDRNLHSLLSRRFGPAFDDVPFGQKGPGSRFMTAFETLKRDFGRNDEKEVGELGPLNLAVSNSDHYDEEDRLVLLTHEDMEDLFDPVVAEITSLVKEQVKAAKAAKNAIINRIILVGGFAESPHLNKELKKWCRQNGNITLIRPLHPQSAVVRGAALRGLKGISPQIKQLRRHYGICLAMPFREGIDPEESAFIDTWNNLKRCRGRMWWLIFKGDDIKKGTSRLLDCNQVCTLQTDTVLASTLYQCVLAQPPEYVSDPGVERVGDIRSNLGNNFDFGENIERQYNAQLGRMVQRVSFQQRIVFGNKGDNLTFSCLIGGKEICKSEMSFDR